MTPEVRQFITILIGIVGGFVYQYLKHKGIVGFEYPDFGNFECAYVRARENVLGAEDMARLTDDIFISTSNSLLELEAGAYPQFTLENIPNGALYAVNARKREARKIKIVDYPKDTDFRPHGLYLDRTPSLLYVINHAYARGGERVDVFKIRVDNDQDLEFSAVYQTSTLFDSERFNGILNDLIVVQGHLVVTKYLPYADALHGRNTQSSFANDLSVAFAHAFQRRNTHAYWCVFKAQQYADCLQIDSTASVMANGITWNGKNQVLINDQMAREVRVFALNAKNAHTDPQSVLTLEKTIKIKGHPDNIDYDPKRKAYYVAGFGRVKDLDKYVAAFQSEHRRPQNMDEFENTAFAVQINEEDLKASDLLVKSGTDVLFGASYAFAVDENTVILGSSKDVSCQVCVRTPY